MQNVLLLHFIHFSPSAYSYCDFFYYHFARLRVRRAKIQSERRRKIRTR